jgi:hypothetical protein
MGRVDCTKVRLGVNDETAWSTKEATHLAKMVSDTFFASGHLFRIQSEHVYIHGSAPNGKATQSVDDNSGQEPQTIRA